MNQKNPLTKMLQQQKKVEELERAEIEPRVTQPYNKLGWNKKKASRVKQTYERFRAEEETNLDKMREELQHFKKAFQEIKNVTGVADVNGVSEIIQKSMTQGDTLNGLKIIKNEKTRRLEELNMRREKLT